MTDQGASYNAISEITRLQKENQQLREDKKELLAELYSLAFDEGVLGKGGALPKWTATLVQPIKGDAMEMAKQMWDAYAFRAGGKTFDGKLLPTWDGLGDERQSCWVAAASVTADRIEQLETALREIIEIHPFKDPEGDASVKAVVDLMFHINLTARRALNTSQERVKNNGES